MQLATKLWFCTLPHFIFHAKSNGDSGLIPTRPYPQEATLSPTPGDFVLFWDPGDDVITFEVHARTNSWVGLGISRTGSMTDSDIAIGWINEERKAILQDRYATGRTAPRVDPHQDLTLFSGQYTGTHTILTFSRKHDTCDDNDIEIEHMNVKLIWAYGRFKMEDGDEPPQHEHAARGTKTVKLLASMTSKDHRLPPEAYSIDVMIENQQIPEQVEMLYCHAQKIPNIQLKRHIIMIEPVIQVGNEDLVYLMSLNLARAGKDGTIYDWSGPCSEQPFSTDAGRPLTLYARGGQAQYLPEDTGLPFGGSDSFSQAFDYFLLLIATENWDNRKDRSDSSGLRVWVTDTPRRFDAGFTSVGAIDAYLPPQSPSFFIYGFCSVECLSQAMGEVPEITIFAMLLQVHLVGSSVVVRQIRDGTELPPVARERYHDKWYGDYHVLPEPRKVKKGDLLIIECGYNTQAKEEHTVFDIYGNNELCFAWFFLYPALDLRICETRPTSKQGLKFLNLDIDHDSKATVTTPGEYFGKTALEVLNMQNWKDKSIRDGYQQTIREGDFQDFCKKADTDHAVSGYPADRTITEVKQPERPWVGSGDCPTTSVSRGPIHLFYSVTTVFPIIVFYHLH